MRGKSGLGSCEGAVCGYVQNLASIIAAATAAAAATAKQRVASATASDTTRNDTRVKLGSPCFLRDVSLADESLSS